MSDLKRTTINAIDEITNDSKQAARLRLIAEFIKDAAASLDGGDIGGALAELRCAQGFYDRLDYVTRGRIREGAE